MRSVWKGHIRFSMVSIPIRLYTAVDSSQTIRFNQLHKEDHGRIGYDKKCKACSTEVGTSDIVKGYEYEKDGYVVIEDEDLEKIKPKSSKVIEIEGFVEDADLHPMLYDSPFLVGPDGPIAAKPYSLLRETLSSSDKLGVGRIVMRDKEEVVAISPQDDGLVLYKLRNPVALRKISDMPGERNEEVSKAELELAQTLVGTMSTKLEDLELTDRYHEAVKQMVQAKVEGKEVVAAADEEESVIDITAALKQSIEQAKSMRAPGAKKPVKKAAKKAKAAAKKPRKARKIA